MSPSRTSQRIVPKKKRDSRRSSSRWRSFALLLLMGGISLTIWWWRSLLDATDLIVTDQVLSSSLTPQSSFWLVWGGTLEVTSRNDTATTKQLASLSSSSSTQQQPQHHHHQVLVLSSSNDTAAHTNWETLQEYYEPAHIADLERDKQARRQKFKAAQDKRRKERRERIQQQQIKQQQQHQQQRALTANQSETEAAQQQVSVAGNWTTQTQPPQLTAGQGDGISWEMCLAKTHTEYRQRSMPQQRQYGLPLLASVVRAPDRLESKQQQQPLVTKSNVYWTATFSLCDITWRKGGRERKRIPHVSSSDHWWCNNNPAHVIAKGCPSGSTVSIRCPNVDESLHTITHAVNTTWNYTYQVGSFVACETEPSVSFETHMQQQQQQQVREPNSSTVDHVASSASSRIVASVLLYQVSVTMLLEWVTYHRLLGVHHFWVYVMQDHHDLPDLEYVTYIPWNLNPDMSRTWDIFLFQTAAQVDSLHRARQWNGQYGHLNPIEWILYNDLDEFLVLRQRPRQSLASYLASHQKYDAIQFASVTFGSAHPLAHPLEFQLNYTWRSVQDFGAKRCKTAVQPGRVDYYNIHWVTEPNNNLYKAPTSEAWIHHYKKPNRGVFRRELRNKEIVQDVALRDEYLGTVQEHVSLIQNTSR